MPHALINKEQPELATLKKLRETVLKELLTPVPCNETLRAWFDEAEIPRLKANHGAKRGGGPVYYSVAHIVKLIKEKIGAPND